MIFRAGFLKAVRATRLLVSGGNILLETEVDNLLLESGDILLRE